MNENTKQTDVAILGGGIAGLTCGVALAKSGLQVTVIEQNEILGGRARSWDDPETGDAVHIGPHILLSEYPNFLELLDLLGTKDQVYWQENIFVRIADGEDIAEKHQVDWLPAPFKYVPNEMQDDNYSTRDILSNLPVLLYALTMDEEDFRRLDSLNAYGFLRSMGVRDEFIDSVWRFTCRSIMNCPLELCSAGALMRFYQRFIGYDGYQIGFPKIGLGDLFAPGSKDVIKKHDGEVLLDAAVEEFIRHGDKVSGIILDDGRRIEADYCVSGLPADALQGLLPREWIKSYETFSKLGLFEPCPYVSPYIWFDRKVTDMEFWARKYNYSDLNCDFYDLSNIYSERESENSFITSNIIYSQRIGDMSDEEIFQETLREIRETLPAARNADVEHWTVNRIPLAIYCPYPGVEKHRPEPNSPVDNLLLCGDWINTGLPSSMEGAAKSGWMVAEEITDKEGESRKFVQQETELGGLARIVNDFGQWHAIRKIRKWIPPNVTYIISSRRGSKHFFLLMNNISHQ